MRVGKWASGVAESPIGLLLAGAALAYVAVPAVRRSIRPLVVSAVRGAYQVGDRLRDAAMSTAAEMGQIVSEAREGMQQTGGRMGSTMGATMGAAAGTVGATVGAVGVATADAVSEMGRGLADAGNSIKRSARAAADTFVNEVKESMDEGT